MAFDWLVCSIIRQLSVKIIYLWTGHEYEVYHHMPCDLRGTISRIWFEDARETETAVRKTGGVSVHVQEKNRWKSVKITNLPILWFSTFCFTRVRKNSWHDFTKRLYIVVPSTSVSRVSYFIVIFVHFHIKVCAHFTNSADRLSINCR